MPIPDILFCLLGFLLYTSLSASWVNSGDLGAQDYWILFGCETPPPLRCSEADNGLLFFSSRVCFIRGSLSLVYRFFFSTRARNRKNEKSKRKKLVDHAQCLEGFETLGVAWLLLASARSFVRSCFRIYRCYHRQIATIQQEWASEGFRHCRADRHPSLVVV